MSKHLLARSIAHKESEYDAVMCGMWEGDGDKEAGVGGVSEVLQSGVQVQGVETGAGGGGGSVEGGEV